MITLVKRAGRYFINDHRYFIGLGAGMMIVNPIERYFWVGGAWVLVGLVLGMFRSAEHE